ncbi:unnamed protein product [Scytosiphon promiscuus]
MRSAASGFTALACSLLMLSAQAVPSARNLATGDEADADWTYRRTGTSGEEPYGPDEWYLGYPDCALNKQSPINMAADIIEVVSSDEFQLNFYQSHCDASALTFVANYAVWQVEYGACTAQPSLMFQGETYNLLQFHIHSPSENTFGGAEYAADIHMVHTKEETGDLLVVGVMLEVSEYGHNVELQSLWDVLGMGVNATSADFSSAVYDILPGNPTFTTFSGSLTTPPCSEGVRWIVMNEPVVMSKEQLESYRDSVASYPDSKVDEFGNTNRHTQPINGRGVYYVLP